MRFLPSLVALISWRAVGAVVVILERIVLAAVLGPSQLGAFGLATGTVSILSRWLSFGAGPAAQFVGGRGQAPERSARSVLALAVGIGSVAGAVSWLALPVLDRLVFSGQPAGFEIFRRLQPWLPVVVVGMAMSLFLLGRGRLRVYGLLQVLPEAGFLAVLLVGWAIGLGVAGAVIGQVVAWATLLIGALVGGWTLWGRGAVDARIVREVAAYGVRSWPLVMLQFGIARIALLVGARFVSAEALGYYVLASGLADALTIIPSLAAQLVFNATSGARDGVRDLAFRVIRLSTWGLLVGGVVIAVVGKPFFILAFGSRFEPAWALMVILLGTTVTRGVLSLQLAFLSGRGRPGKSNYSQVTELVLLLVLVPIAAGRFGATGMAAAAVAASAVGVLVASLLVTRLEGIRIGDLLLVRRDDLVAVRRRMAEMLGRRVVGATHAD
ncbi:MAG: oligosaccharide flippase family protein [Gemmatimonadales bacterium]|nr:oligosaccharide flippase family protein [Gemmatimonadales bacterium]